jgi:hypothetical protein
MASKHPFWPILSFEKSKTCLSLKVSLTRCGVWVSEREELWEGVGTSGAEKVAAYALGH